ncbi:MAG: hypothetical protein J0H55_13430 [Chitinophagaceae bacterium]|nr:hypothetical protein [Chitinophagaceae bacterium]
MVERVKQNMMYRKLVKLFLRFAIAAGFLSAVGDRFGMWHYHLAWGNWNHFLQYTGTLNPWFPQSAIPTLGVISTIAEIVFALALIIGYKTELFAKLSGILLLIFALSMTFSTGIKTAFDASVFAASGAAFALATLKEKFWEVDSLISMNRKKV